MVGISVLLSTMLPHYPGYIFLPVLMGLAQRWLSNTFHSCITSRTYPVPARAVLDLLLYCGCWRARQLHLAPAPTAVPTTFRRHTGTISCSSMDRCPGPGRRHRARLEIAGHCEQACLFLTLFQASK